MRPALVLCALLAAAPPGACADEAPERLRGLSWVAGGHIGGEELRLARATGAGWLAQTPFAFMRDPRSPELRFATGNEWYWGESDRGLVETHRMARALGLKTLLKPHIWLHRSWPGDIQMTGDDEWRRWFEGYSRYLLHHAELAECEGMEMLSVGCELKQVTREREAEFRELIAEVRAVYHGPLVYAANWDEVFDVPFWDALDYVGVNAYFPLDGAGPADWVAVAKRLGALSRRTGKQVILTELGYPAAPGCTGKPWEDRQPAGGAEGEACQARALEAAFSALWPQPWLAGAFLWKWFPDPTRADDGRAFDLHGRPAARVIERWYR